MVANRFGEIFFAHEVNISDKWEHGGGFRRPDAAIEWFKSLVDAVNVDHIASNEACGTDQIDELREFGDEVARITFYDSVVVIEKLSTPKRLPYRRIMSGRNDPVVNAPQILSLLSPRELASLKLSDSAAGMFLPALVENLASAREEGPLADRTS